MQVPNVVVTGSSKTGTSGLYNAVWAGMVEATEGRCYGLRERDDLALLRSLRLRAPDRVLAAKFLLTSRAFQDALIEPFDQHLMTVRDPRDTLLSVALFYPVKAANDGVPNERIDEFVDLLRRKQAEPASVSFLDIFSEVHRLIGRSIDPSALPLRRFRLAIHHAATHTPHIVQYERFIVDDLPELTEHLGFEVRNERPKDYTSFVFRSGGAGEWRDWFTAADVDLFRPLLQPYMERFGYADDWELPSEPHIRPEHGSEYVLRSVAKRRSQMELSRGEGATEHQLQYLRELAEAGSAAASVKLAARLQQEDPTGSAIEIRDLLTYAAAGGSPRAMRRLADHLATGPEEVRDLVAARRWEVEFRVKQMERELARVRQRGKRASRALDQQRAERARVERELEDLRRSRHVRVAAAVAEASAEGPRGWLRLPRKVTHIVR